MRSSAGVLLFVLLLVAGCRSTEKGIAKNAVAYDDLAIVQHDHLEFTVTGIDTTSLDQSNRILVRCSIVNRNKETVNYLQQSCNGLDYYLLGSPDMFKVQPQYHCNGSWAQIKELAAEDTLTFETYLDEKKVNTGNYTIGINFIAVNRLVPFEVLRKHPEIAEDVYLQPLDSANILWAK